MSIPDGTFLGVGVKTLLVSVQNLPEPSVNPSSSLGVASIKYSHTKFPLALRRIVCVDTCTLK